MSIPQPLQTRLKILFETEKAVDFETHGAFFVDVTEDITPDMLSFSYEDKEKEEADEISLNLKDETCKWAGKWKPEGGEKIKAYIMPGNVEKQTGSLFCGTFYVDDVEISGAPRTCSIKAVSIPLNKPIRRKMKTKAWEEKDLKGIAEEIAKESGLKLLFDSDSNPKYDRKDQSRESDLQFLSKLCDEAGCSVKVTDTQLVIFDQASYEKKKPIKTYTLGKSDILSWKFSVAQSETYKSCEVKYYNTEKREFIGYVYTDPTVDENGQEYSMKARASDIQEAKQLACAKLRQLNLRKVTGSMTVIGDIELLAGSVIVCKGFGNFDGNFIIEKASHSVGSGYTTSVDLRRVNTNF